MTLDQLQIFIAVAEREHVTRAADALGLAPPSVSAAVASLEREFGTKLFHRVGRGIALTEGGKLLLEEAHTLVNRADAVKLAMREFTGLSRGRLELTIHEGRKHQVKRMCAAVGLPVRRLHRSRYGPLDLGGLTAGTWRELRRDEVAALRKVAGL